MREVGNPDVVKQLDVITDNAVQKALDEYASLTEQLRAIVSSANSEADVISELNKFGSKPLQSLADQIFEALDVADSLGRSGVVRKDRELSAEASATGKDDDGNWITADDPTVKISFDLIPKDALEVLRQKALKIAGDESGELAEAVKVALQKSLAEGKTFAEFKQDVDHVFAALGVTPLSPRHIETIFRTNIFAAYSIGESQQAASIADRFPLAYFLPIHDDRSRHRPLEGYYQAAAVPLPPVDYNCRCTVRYIHVSEVTGNETPLYDSPPRPDLIRFDQRNSI